MCSSYDISQYISVYKSILKDFALLDEIIKWIMKCTYILGFLIVFRIAFDEFYLFSIFLSCKDFIKLPKPDIVGNDSSELSLLFFINPSVVTESIHPT